jgi:coenzyme F420 hydrogenase subunit beta
MNVGMTIVKDDMCIGCGVCVPVCPIDVLSMIWKNGKFEAFHKVEDCLSRCDICFKACPFDDKSSDEDVLAKDLYSEIEHISHHSDCGYYLDCFVGHSPLYDQRFKSASGGLTSYLLEELLKNKLIDGVACVSKSKKQPEMFEYTLCNTIEEVNQCSGSAYYPVEVSSILEYIMENDGKYAIVALPCISTGIRNAMKFNKKLRGRIKYIIGLVCGQTKTDYFVRYLAEKEKMHQISEINFRTKSYNYPIKNYGVRLSNSFGKEKVANFSTFSKEWSDRFFTPNACNFCDDIFAETSDIAIMDAWLPKYDESNEGHNLILSRNTELSAMLNSISTVENIHIDDVLKSQELVVSSKRSDITERIRVALKNGDYVPKKRQHILKKVKFEMRYIVGFLYTVSKRTQKFWYETNGNYSQFMHAMKLTKKEIFIRRQIYRFFKILKILKVIK